MLKLYFQKELIEAGCDEAGRGCLAGPVFAAAVILPKKISKSDFAELNDSKQLNEKQRKKLKSLIEKKAISWTVAKVDNEKIDEINILNASILAMHIAIEKLDTAPGLLLIDGNRFKQYQNISHQCIVKGDAKYMSIAAASVLAKTYRDDYMEMLHNNFPQYQWNKNKGYPTTYHRQGIRQFGITSHHRKTFQLLPKNELLLFPAVSI